MSITFTRSLTQIDVPTTNTKPFKQVTFLDGSIIDYLCKIYLYVMVQIIKLYHRNHSKKKKKKKAKEYDNQKSI